MVQNPTLDTPRTIQVAPRLSPQRKVSPTLIPKRKLFVWGISTGENFAMCLVLLCEIPHFKLKNPMIRWHLSTAF
jgi:hypothetical protein